MRDAKSSASPIVGHWLVIDPAEYLQEQLGGWRGCNRWMYQALHREYRKFLCNYWRTHWPPSQIGQIYGVSWTTSKKLNEC